MDQACFHMFTKVCGRDVLLGDTAWRLSEAPLPPLHGSPDVKPIVTLMALERFLSGCSLEGRIARLLGRVRLAHSVSNEASLVHGRGLHATTFNVRLEVMTWSIETPLWI